MPQNGLVPRDAAPYQPLPDRDVQLPDTLRNLGPQAAILGVDQPNAAAVGAHQATCHAGIEHEQVVEILRCADFGCVLEDYTGNSILGERGSARRCMNHCYTVHQTTSLSAPS